MYAFGRVILGAYRSPRAVGLFEGPVRAHNLLYALGGALAVPVVPTASRYVATGDERRLRELAVRGTRYTLALFVPVCVTLIVLAEPILDVWLGDRYGDGGAALAILVSYWLLYGGLVVTPGFLVGAGRARDVARVMVVVGGARTWRCRSCSRPSSGSRDRRSATAIPFFAGLPVPAAARAARLGRRRCAELARRAWLPTYVLGAVLAARAGRGRARAADPDSLRR